MTIPLLYIFINNPAKLNAICLTHISETTPHMMHFQGKSSLRKRRGFHTV
jgi:hypothetical protein